MLEKIEYISKMLKFVLILKVFLCFVDFFSELQCFYLFFKLR
jgi:hypothetical protein